MEYACGREQCDILFKETAASKIMLMRTSRRRRQRQQLLAGAGLGYIGHKPQGQALQTSADRDELPKRSCTFTVPLPRKSCKRLDELQIWGEMLAESLWDPSSLKKCTDGLGIVT